MARAAFTQADVCRAMRGAQAAGREPAEVRIRDGEIVLSFGRRGAQDEATPQDVADEIAGWADGQADD